MAAVTGMVVAFVLISAASAWAYSTDPLDCASCHGIGFPSPDTIKYGPHGGIAEGRDNSPDFCNGKYIRNRRIADNILKFWPGNSGSGFDRTGAEKFLTAAVFNLDAGPGTFILDHVRQPRQSGNVFIRADPQLAMGRLAGNFIDIGILDNQKPHSAFGNVPVMTEQTLGDGAVHIAHAGGGGGLDDPVGNLKGSDAAWSKQLVELVCHFFLQNMVVMFDE